MIKLDSINLEAFDKSKGDHYRLARKLSEDLNVKKYITGKFGDWVEQDDRKDPEFKKSYIIYDQDKAVGMCGSHKFDSNGVMDLWIAISSGERGQNYAEKVTVQLTPYLVENIKGLTDIRLLVDRCNYPSNHTAVKSGYTLTDTYADMNEYRLFGGKK